MNKVSLNLNVKIKFSQLQSNLRLLVYQIMILTTTLTRYQNLETNKYNNNKIIIALQRWKNS